MGGDTLTVYLKWQFDDGTPVVDVKGSDTVGAMKEKVGEELMVAAEDFTMYLDGHDLGDMGVVVAKTALSEGAVVDVVPSKQFEAKRELESIGLRCSDELLGRDVLRCDTIASTDEEKARITQLMIDFDNPNFGIIDPLLCSAAEGFLHVVKVLAPLIDINEAREGRGFAALHVASKGGHEAVVRYLITECHADVNITNDYGITPVTWPPREVRTSSSDASKPTAPTPTQGYAPRVRSPYITQQGIRS